MKLVPPKKDLMEFVKENPLSYFIDIAHGDFSDESEEYHSDNPKREETSKEECKEVTPLINLQAGQNMDGRQLEPHTRLEAPVNEPTANTYTVMPSNIIALESALHSTEESMKDLLDNIVQVTANEQYNIGSNNVYSWQNLCNTAFRINKVLQEIKHVYQRVGCCSSNIFAQYPFMYTAQQNPNI